MTEGIRALCMLEVVNEFAESIGEEAFEGFRYGDQKTVLDVCDYRVYCERLLSMNGLSPERDMEEMEKFMQDVLFLILHETGTPVSAMRWLDDNTIQLIK